jgi:hypothetical protein
MKRYVISSKNFKNRPPLQATMTFGMLLYLTNAREWVWGAVGLLFLLAWIVYFVEFFKYDNEEIDIFDLKTKDGERITEINVKSAWQQRLEEVQAKAKK